MSGAPSVDRPSPWPMLAVGIATGVLVGLLMSLSPVLTLVIVGVLAVATGAAIRGPGNLPRATFLAGTVLGAGGVLLYGAVNTIQACAKTGDFCGQANVWPLLVLALAALAIGTLATGVTMRRARRRSI